MVNILEINSVDEKLHKIEEMVHGLLLRPTDLTFQSVPLVPARDVPILKLNGHPPKKGLSFEEGRARMMHDLGNIELQAMELALRTMIEFPDAPKLFR